MAFSSDAVIKQEIIDTIGYRIGPLILRVFPESSKDDQKLFEKGGLTFRDSGFDYGSCDACWYVKHRDRNLGEVEVPVIAFEGTDALNRKSSGNAQYQRFHHALGAVKRGIIGVYYLRKGTYKIQEDLYGMAHFASKREKGIYLIIDDLSYLKGILESYLEPSLFKTLIRDTQNEMYRKFKEKFDKKYNGSWEIFAKKRSTIIKNSYVIKHAGRMRRNFTDSSQRAGHIAVGEMFLTKYYFYEKKLYYLFPKMFKEDLVYLDEHKSNDKEWYLLRHEPNVEIKTIDDITGIPDDKKRIIYSIRNTPIKGETLKIYKKFTKELEWALRNDKWRIN